MADDYLDKVTDERWSMGDKEVQMGGVIELNKRSTKWVESQKATLKKLYEQEIYRLQRGEKGLRDTEKNAKEGIKTQMLKELHSDRELERICSSLNPEEIIDTLEQVVFCKRKEYDRIKHELDKKEREFYNKMLEMEDIKESDQREKVSPSMERKLSECANQIQRVLLQLDAARVVENSYDKMIKILEKDARSFDAILAGLKMDMVIQCQCIIHAMELGQRATEDTQQLKKQYQKELVTVKDSLTKHEEKVEAAKKNLKNIKEACAKVLRTESFVKLPIWQLSPASEANKQSLIKQKLDLEDSLEKLKETTSSLTYDDIFFRYEDVLKGKYRLLRQLDINKVWTNTELTRQRHTETVHDTLTYSVINGTKEFEQEKERLESEIQKQKDLYEEYKRKFRIDNEYLAKIRIAVLHFNELLSRVKIVGYEPSSEESGFDVENYAELTKTSKEETDEDDDEVKFNVDEEVVKPDFINVAQMIDVLGLKIALLMKQCSVKELNDEEILAAEELYEKLMQQEVGPPKERYVEGPSIGKIDQYSMPDRKLLKMNSRRIVEKEEAKPPPPKLHDKVVKHDCY